MAADDFFAEHIAISGWAFRLSCSSEWGSGILFIPRLCSGGHAVPFGQGLSSVLACALCFSKHGLVLGSEQSAVQVASWGEESPT